MIQRSSRHKQRPSLTFNMAPMIDVVFLLIIFFVLVSTFASAERVPMELPDPDESKAQNVQLKDRVIINVELADPTGPIPDAVVYSIGANRVQTVDQLSERIGLHARLVPDLKVVIRADRRVRYGHVRKVMKVVAENGIEKMNIVAHVGNGKTAP